MAEFGSSMTLRFLEEEVERYGLDIPIELLEEKLECAPEADLTSSEGQFFVGLLFGRLLERGELCPEFP